MAEKASDQLKAAVLDVGKALGERLASQATEKVGDVTGKLNKVSSGEGKLSDVISGGSGLIGGLGGGKKDDQNEDSDEQSDDSDDSSSPVKGGVMSGIGEAMSEGKSPVMGALKGGAKGIKDKITGKGKGSQSKRPTNITDEYWIGMPVEAVYNQWTMYKEFPGYMKGPIKADVNDDYIESNWSAKIFLNTRSWQAKTVEMIPNERIKWKTSSNKGTIDGCITFHEVADRLTLMIFVLEYRPKGFFEWWGNRWRTVGRRYRLDVKHFRRYLTMNGEVVPEDGGFRGRIEGGEVVETNDDAREREDQEREDQDTEEQDTEQENPEEENADEPTEEDGSEEEPGEPPAEPTEEETNSEEEPPEEGDKPEEPEPQEPGGFTPEEQPAEEHPQE